MFSTLVDAHDLQSAVPRAKDLRQQMCPLPFMCRLRPKRRCAHICPFAAAEASSWASSIRLAITGAFLAVNTQYLMTGKLSGQLSACFLGPLAAVCIAPKHEALCIQYSLKLFLCRHHSDSGSAHGLATHSGLRWGQQGSLRCGHSCAGADARAQGADACRGARAAQGVALCIQATLSHPSEVLLSALPQHLQ